MEESLLRMLEVLGSVLRGTRLLFSSLPGSESPLLKSEHLAGLGL